MFYIGTYRSVLSDQIYFFSLTGQNQIYMDIQSEDVMNLKRDTKAGIAGIIAVLLFFIETQNMTQRPNLIEPGPRMMPYVGLFLILISSVMLLIRGLKNRDEEKPYFPEGGIKKVIIGFSEVLLYGILLTLFGFLPTTPFAMFAFVNTLKGTEKVKWWQNALISIMVTLCLYAMFVLGFRIKLPAGILFR